MEVPWILGHRGSPREAPENTRASLARALALGLDGVAWDAAPCASGELVLCADESLERTTDGTGRLAERTWVELAHLDAGASFHARFRGERLLLAEEALALTEERLALTEERLALASDGARAQLHLALLSASGSASELARLAREHAPGFSLRAAARERDLTLEARDAGLSACAIVDELDERVLARAAEDKLAALAAPGRVWLQTDGASSVPCERWALDVDDPAELLALSRAPVFALTTREPRRALAARTLAKMAPHGPPEWPITAPALDVRPEEQSGAWQGSWEVRVRLANPLPFRVRAALTLELRRGAFDVRGLPAAFELEPGTCAEHSFALSGGAAQPGGDPLLVALFAWEAGPGRGAGNLLLDSPLARVRTAIADAQPRRLALLAATRGDGPAALVVRRDGPWLLVSREATGGLADPRVVVRLGDAVHSGARGVRAPLPGDFDRRAEGVPFACGLRGSKNGERVWRRWSGGLSDEPDPGAPGRLVPRARG